MPVTLCFWKWTGWHLSYSWRGLKSCSGSASQQSTTQHSLQGCISTDFWERWHLAQLQERAMSSVFLWMVKYYILCLLRIYVKMDRHCSSFWDRTSCNLTLCSWGLLNPVAIASASHVLGIQPCITMLHVCGTGVLCTLGKHSPNSWSYSPPSSLCRFPTYCTFFKKCFKNFIVTITSFPPSLSSL